MKIQQEPTLCLGFISLLLQLPSKNLKKKELQSEANPNFPAQEELHGEREDKAAFGLVYFLAKAIRAPVF